MNVFIFAMIAFAVSCFGALGYEVQKSETFEKACFNKEGVVASIHGSNVCIRRSSIQTIEVGK